MVTGHGGEPAALPVLLDHDDAQTVGGPGDLGLLAGGVGGVVSLEHQDFVRVLVVRHEQLTAALARQREQREEVAVVAELARLRLGGLLVRVEGRGAAQDGLAPADDHVLAVALGDGHGVGGVRRDGGEAQAAGGLAAGEGGGRALGCLGGGRGRARADDRAPGGDGDGHGGCRAHHGTAADRSGDDVADVFVGAGVGRRVKAGVTAAVPTGHLGPAARV